MKISLAAVSSDKYPEFKNRYLALKKRRVYKKAIIAIARMLLTAIYQILMKSEPYNPEPYIKSDVIPSNIDVSLEQAIFILQRQGYTISKV